MRYGRSLVVAAGLGAVLGFARPVSANEPVTANSLQIGLGFRYGLELNEGDFNPWGSGLGIDGGYTLPNAVYVGGVFEYFFGETIERDNFAIGESTELSGNVWHFLAEGGYDVGLGRNFVIRPKAGLGVAGVSSEFCTDLGCESESDVHFALAPGATFMLFTGSGFSLSIDTRYAMIFADETARALVFSLGFGF